MPLGYTNILHNERLLFMAYRKEVPTFREERQKDEREGRSLSEPSSGLVRNERNKIKILLRYKQIYDIMSL